MKTVAEIEAAIAKLSREEFRMLMAGLRERDAAEWDRQIEEDAQSGRLHALYLRLQKEGDGHAV